MKERYECLYKEKSKYPIGPLNIMRDYMIIKQIKNNNLKILDLGCGRGFLVNELSKIGHIVTGIDISENAVEHCKKLNPKARLICGDFRDLKLKENFDYIICSEVLEHVEDDENAISKIKGWMGDKSRLIITVPYNQKQWNKVDELSGHYRRYSVDELKLKLEKNGLIIEKNVVWGFPLLRVYWWLYRFTVKKELPLGYAPKGRLLYIYIFDFKILLKAFF